MTSTDLAHATTLRGETVLSGASDADEVMAACVGTLRPHQLQVRSSGGLGTSLSHLAVGGFSVNRLVYGADVTIAPAVSDDDNFLLTLPVAGHASFRYGAERADATAARGVLIGPYREFAFDIDASFDQLIVRLDRTRVEAAAAALTGVTGPVHFELALAPEVSRLDGLLLSAVELAASGLAESRPQLLWQVEQLLVETLLLTQPHDRSAALGGGPAPSERVRRATSYMNDRLGEPLGIGEVAAACGVSVRSLQEAFRRDLDTTPLQWLRSQRLERARVLLGAGGTTVTEVAYACGFLHLGEFGAAFKRRYGETPSALIARSK
ncbi:AraC family transcriptional regulator [Nocardioides maradonensis]